MRQDYKQNSAKTCGNAMNELAHTLYCACGKPICSKWDYKEMKFGLITCSNCPTPKLQNRPQWNGKDVFYPFNG